HTALESQRAVIVFGKQHANALIVAGPASIDIAAIGQMRRQKSVEVIIAEGSLKRHKPNFLEHHIAIGIGKDFFLDPIPSLDFCIDQFVDRDAGFNRQILKPAMTLLLGKKARTIGNDQSLIASASLIDTGEVDFIQNAVAQGEPY